MNRLTRDEILLRALGLVDSPRLDEKDRPAGTIVATALSIGWLQDGLDLAHNLYPMSAQLKTATFDVLTGVGSYTVLTIAADFILDFKDGVILPDDKGRLARSSLSTILGYRTATGNRARPSRYALHNGLLVLRPVPEADYLATTLYYYALPAVLTGTTVPSFPADFMLVEFIHQRGREWLREAPSGTAESYLLTAVSRLQKAGLGSEAEIDDTIGIDRHVFPGGGVAYGDETGWMGSAVPNG